MASKRDIEASGYFAAGWVGTSISVTASKTDEPDRDVVLTLTRKEAEKLAESLTSLLER